MDNDVLLFALAAAVPIRIAELMRLPSQLRNDTGSAWAAAGVDAVACHGDTLQFGGRKGEAANVFNALARGLAALALAPGGVHFAGQHWCVQHPVGCTGRPADLDCEATGYTTPAHRAVITTASV